MTTQAAWTEIARRAAEAEGEDEALAGDVAKLLGWTYGKTLTDQRPYWRKPGVTDTFWGTELIRPDTSVDAALALVEEKLPGSPINIEVRDDGASVVLYVEDDNDRDTWFSGEAATAPLALLSAFALAMAEQGGAE